jgi:hypothetical protein
MHLSNMSLLRTTLSAVALLVLCALGPAPIRGDRYGIKPHDNLQKQDEKTLEAEQHPVVMGQVGAPTPAHVDVQMGTESGGQDASAVLSAAQRNGKSPGGSSASQVIGAASRRIQTGPSYSWIWGVLILGCVVGGIFGVKRWADNNVPNMPTITSKRQGW